MVKSSKTKGEAPARRQGLATSAGLINTLLTPAVRQRGLAKSEMITRWPDIIGARLAAMSEPLRLGGRHRVLELAVLPVAALEFQHEEPRLIDRINTYLGFDAVRRLRLRQTPSLRRKLEPRPSAEVTLSEREEAALERATAGVQDESLRAALVRLGRRVTAASRG
ncbi:MAG: DUF721 domain-containing protein [Geminicoccaceae bacterium]